MTLPDFHRAWLEHWPSNTSLSARGFREAIVKVIADAKPEAVLAALKAHRGRSRFPPSAWEIAQALGGEQDKGYQPAFRPVKCRNGCGWTGEGDGAEAIHAAPGGPCPKAASAAARTRKLAEEFARFEAGNKK